MLTSGVQFIMEARFLAEQQNPGNWCLRPPMMREQQVARVPLLDLVSAKKQLKPASEDNKAWTTRRHPHNIALGRAQRLTPLSCLYTYSSLAFQHITL
ncbi:hypothetical protein J6590_019260 [Homalodisca vitripennis]|nr:hypothetical protein J6590_019260 [Homalodisca vitripennis]